MKIRYLAVIAAVLLAGCQDNPGNTAVESSGGAGSLGFSTLASSGTPQASITVNATGQAPAQYNNTEWSVTKTGVYTAGEPVVDNVFDEAGNLMTPGNVPGSVTYVVTASKVSTSNNVLALNGSITFTNTGGAPATMGNIVINLQKSATYKGKGVWVSAAADMANSLASDGANSANIVAKGSQEDPAANAAVGAGNYSVNGSGVGTFSETAGSGALEFTDASNNTLFAMNPRPSVPAGGTVTLLYTARFNNSVLNLGTGALLRAEALLTFGNAGSRGGSGAVANNVDINSNGTLDADESNVRTVPTRFSVAVPALVQANCSATLTDSDANLTAGGTVTHDAAADIGAALDCNAMADGDSAVSTITVNTNSGISGGALTNDVNVTSGPGVSVTLDTYTFNLQATQTTGASATVTIPGPPNVVIHDDGFVVQGDGTTYTQGGWSAPPNGNNPAALLAANFSTVYPSGSVSVGGGFTMTFTAGTVSQNVCTGQGKDRTCSIQSVSITAAQAIGNYLPAGGTAGALTGPPLVNPTSSSAGVFGGQVLALQLNVDFSAAGITAGTGPLGNLVLTGTGTAFDGMTVAQILAAANVALGGGGGDIATLNDLCDKLNNAFDNGNMDGWASTHLTH